MCGVHNYTKNLMVQHLQSFVLKGTSDSREKTVIDQFVTRLNKPNCTLLQFFNISFVNIANLTMRCPSLNVIESHIIVKSSTLYGHTDTKETFSFINITGRGSQGLLDNCTFKENFFIMSNLSDGITVSNSTFQLCRHQFNSIIMAYSSVVTLTGSVNFTDSATGIHLPARPSGTAVFLRNTYPELKSVLIITTGATVYFVNLTCNHYGGAIYVENGIINVSNESTVVFAYNSAFRGGALYLVNSVIHVDTNDIHFCNNSASLGGAIYFVYGIMYIKPNKSMKFTTNTAQAQGGAIYIESGVHSSIIVETSAELLLLNNSALQGGALYIIPSPFTIEVGYQSTKISHYTAWLSVP